ncbi:DUF982 domain-containing protein [Sinorhizobium meliloti]|uniref:DUF982 domain-containing protein n=1 Tax=Rhizobium meliloti TaxID=382 RepID=UPI003F5CD974
MSFCRLSQRKYVRRSQMKEVLWRVPLSVTLQNGMSRRFTGPYEALDFLEYEWPCHGKRYHRAVRDCRAALSGILSTEVARASFTTACAEASLACSDGHAGCATELSGSSAATPHH